MNKIVIFNVGGALSVFGVMQGKIFLIDLGKGNGFSPVKDFLLPLGEAGKIPRAESPKYQGMYQIDQLFLSHLDNDHISDYVDFREHFHPIYLTVPNNHPGIHPEFQVDVNLLGEESEARKLLLEDIHAYRGATNVNPYGMKFDNPLVSTIPGATLHFLLPTYCSRKEELRSGYANNLSLVILLSINGKNILFSGDLLKEGMDTLLAVDSDLRQELMSIGLDYLVTPHHGLQTSFPPSLFQFIRGNKVRLNIISEKVRDPNSNENRSDVDGRYWSSDFSTGENTLGQFGAKTSNGHLVIDFDTPDSNIKRFTTTEELLNEFGVGT